MLHMLSFCYVITSKVICTEKGCRSIVVVNVHMDVKQREKRREVRDPQEQIERFVYTQVAIQTGDAELIRKLRERVQLKYTKTNSPTDQFTSLSLPLLHSECLTRCLFTERETVSSRGRSNKCNVEILEAVQKGIFQSELDARLNTTLQDSLGFFILG